MITKEQAAYIFSMAKKIEFTKGDYSEAKRCLDSEDLEGFERICRGYRFHLQDAKVDYKLTDGWAETRHDNGKLCARYFLKGGMCNGPFENWYNNGQINERTTYKDDKLFGLVEIWHKNGQLGERYFTKGGSKIHGGYQTWYDDGRTAVCDTYKDGIKIHAHSVPAPKIATGPGRVNRTRSTR